jgi:hypothetical protein
MADNEFTRRLTAQGLPGVAKLLQAILHSQEETRKEIQELKKIIQAKKA